MFKTTALALMAASLFAGKASAANVEYYTNPKPPGPFSDAVRVDNLLILSGQIGLLPTGKLADGLEAQTRQTMENISQVLKARGLSLNDVVKCTAMLTDMSKWPDFNKVYATYFDAKRLPARSAFGATALALGAELELECWAAIPADKR